jgi:hypothetical protein
MKFRHYIILFLMGLAVIFIPAKIETVPGYMDAEYYYAGGLRLAGGHGFTELFLWNYLDNPAGLPHPSHAYWMPLASLLAAFGIKILGTTNFLGGQLGFLLIAACLPVLTAALSYSLNKRRDAALFSGLLAVFPAFYLPYLSTTDTFGLYMLLGVIFMLVMGKLQRNVAQYLSFNRTQIVWTLSLGVLAGLMHLARADGILWLFFAWVAIIMLAVESRRVLSETETQFEGWALKKGILSVVSMIFLCLAGYLLVMGPWIVRDLIVFGSPFSPGGLKALWVNNYDELFIYPGSLLTFSRWLSNGVGPILQARSWALGQNLISAIAVQGEIILTPLILLGFWRLRRDLRVQIGFLAWVFTLAVMTVIFPFAGVRGGFFHSGASLQPLFWSVVPAGLVQFVEWGRLVRKWDSKQAQRVFGAGLVSLGILLSAFLTYNRVIGTEITNPAWSQNAVRYEQVNRALSDLGASTGDVVMVNDPPGFFLASDRPGISIPYGNLETLKSAAKRYDARYLLLEFNQLQGGDDLYNYPGDFSGLRYLSTVADIRIYKILSSSSP